RVHPDDDLESAAAALDLDKGRSGANVRLISDTGGLGTHAGRLWNGFRVAPRSRIWLDLRRELRGTDAAKSYRATVLDPLWAKEKR
ncbi:MAG TPA: hypothetical protein VMZ51_04515, partial [Acidimicrobiales bacterium]|nr:hypothetical protein [Acidimicrobiales bacterium]